MLFDELEKVLPVERSPQQYLGVDLGFCRLVRVKAGQKDRRLWAEVGD